MTGYHIQKRLKDLLHDRRISFAVYGFGSYCSQIWNEQKREQFHLNISNISADICLSRNAITRHIQALEDIGFLQFTGRSLTNNIKIYVINLDDIEIPDDVSTAPKCSSEGVKWGVNWGDKWGVKSGVNPIYNKEEREKVRKEESIKVRDIAFFEKEFRDQEEHFLRFADHNQIPRDKMPEIIDQFISHASLGSSTYFNITKVNEHFRNWNLSRKSFSKGKKNDYGGINPADALLQRGKI